jgi:hypothetical protein
MFGYREVISAESQKAWDREGIPYDVNRLPTTLLPRNITAEECIRRVLLCNLSYGAWRAPLSELMLSWRITCPEESYESIVDKAGHVCSELQSASNEKNKPKEKKDKELENA